MDGMHDLGGRQGFGAVIREADEPVFHDRWEAFVFTLTHRMLAAGIIRNVDEFRHAIERIDPVAYLTHGYYGRWLGGLETLLLEHGRLDAAGLAERVAALGGDPADAGAARPRQAPDEMAPFSGHGAARTVRRAPLFAVGQLVRTSSMPVSGHTRLPAYARGRIGTVLAHHGGWVFPDSNAHGDGERPQHLYGVRFKGTELWGAEAEPGQSVCLDLFESYLSPVGNPV